jgi:hypothetical protein
MAVLALVAVQAAITAASVTAGLVTVAQVVLVPAMPA